jgi:uncharacterized protein (DUF58 family)
VALGQAPRPTARGVGVVVAGGVVAVCGVLLDSTPLVFAGLVLVLLVVAVLVSLVLRRADLDVARRFSPGRGVAGWSVVETLSLTTRGRSQVVVLREGLPWRGGPSAESATLALEPGRASAAVFRHVDLVRGRHRVGPLTVDLVESFGVGRRRTTVPGTDELVVVPEVLDLGLARESRALGDGARRQRGQSLTGAEDDPVTREYRRGDPMRRVHWKASARHDDLMVRQEEQHGLPHVRLVLPTSQESWDDATAGPGGAGRHSDTFEWALSVVATLAVEWGHAGSVALLTTPEGDLVARHDPESTTAFLDALADVVLDDPAGSPAPPAAAREPVVAVVSSLRRRELDVLLRSRAVGASAVAVVVSPTLGFTHSGRSAADDARDAPLGPEAVAAALRSSRWRVVEAGAGDSVADVVRGAGLLDG